MGCCGNGDRVRTYTSFELLPDNDRDFGEPLTYDRSFKGPLHNRSCTDVICLLIFVVFLGVWGYLAHYAITNGDLNKLLVPTDSQNRKCGIDSGVTDKPYLFFFRLEDCIDVTTPITGCPTPQVCVQKCPEDMFIFDTQKNSMSIDELKKKLICQTQNDYDRINSVEAAEVAVKMNRCARWYVKSKEFLNRCVWDISSSLCPYIPTFLLNNNNKNNNNNNNRYKRDIIPSNTIISTIYNSTLPFPKLMESDNLDVFPPKNIEIYDQRKPVDEPIIECETRKKLGEEIIIRKMQETDTYVARLIGNFVAHFYRGENSAEVGQNIVEDLSRSYVTIFLGLLLAMLVSLIFISLMRWIAAPVLWFSILGALAGIAYGTYFCTTQYIYYRDNYVAPQHSPTLVAPAKSLLQDKNSWLYLTIALAIIFLVILLVVIFLRKRIVIAIALVKEGSKAVSTIISSVFFPIFPWVLQILAIGFALTVGLYLASIGESKFRVAGQIKEGICQCSGPAINYKTGDICDPMIFNQYCHKPQATSMLINYFKGGDVPCDSETGCYFEKISSPKIVTYMHVYNIFGFFWLVFFISALGDMVLAATFATWYWTFHKSDVPYFTTTKALARTLRYHLGTLAFGSLILAICRMIRLILEYIDSKLKKYDNPFTKAILCCCKCFFWCLESFLRFMNRNAYIMCAIHGKNFCLSAKDAFNLLMRNFLRAIALDKVTDFLFFLSKLLLTIAAGFATYYYVEGFSDNRLHYSAVPTTIVVIGTFLITSVFFGVYSMAVDTLFLCFLEDCERNDGSAEKPYYMSKQLMKILGKKNIIPKHQYN